LVKTASRSAFTALKSTAARACVEAALAVSQQIKVHALIF